MSNNSSNETHSKPLTRAVLTTGRLCFWASGQGGVKVRYLIGKVRGRSVEKRGEMG